MQLKINLTSGAKVRHNFPSPFERGKFSSLSYRESNLSLISRETMRLLVDDQPIPIGIQTKSIFLAQICYKRSQGIVFFFRRQKTT